MRYFEGVFFSRVYKVSAVLIEKNKSLFSSKASTWKLSACFPHRQSFEILSISKVLINSEKIFLERWITFKRNFSTPTEDFSNRRLEIFSCSADNFQSKFSLAWVGLKANSFSSKLGQSQEKMFHEKRNFAFEQKIMFRVRMRKRLGEFLHWLRYWTG